VREADTQLYSIGIFDPFEYRSRTQEELNGPSLLSEMTELTGGRAFTVENLNDLPDIAAKIGSDCAINTSWGTAPAIRPTMPAGGRLRSSCAHPRDFLL
jgi:hypothetical protein